MKLDAARLFIFALILSGVPSMVLANQGPEGSGTGSGEGADAGPPPAGSLKDACQQDAALFCKEIQPGGGRIIACLEDHYQDISENCYQALDRMAPPEHAKSSEDENKAEDDRTDPGPSPDEENGSMPPPHGDGAMNHEEGNTSSTPEE